MNSEHPTDQIESYIAGGVFGEELAAFEAHLAGCESCRAAVDAARAADGSVAKLFAGERPAAGFEDRVIQRLRQRQPRLARPIVNPWVRRAAVGVAASLLLAGIGYAGTVAMNGGKLAWLTGKGGGVAYSVLDRDDRTVNHTSSKDLVDGLFGGLEGGRATIRLTDRSQMTTSHEPAVQATDLSVRRQLAGQNTTRGSDKLGLSWGYATSNGTAATGRDNIYGRAGEPAATPPAKAPFDQLDDYLLPTDDKGMPPENAVTTGGAVSAKDAKYFAVDGLARTVPDTTDAPDFSLNPSEPALKVEKKLGDAGRGFKAGATPLSDASGVEIKQREFGRLSEKIGGKPTGNRPNGSDEAKLPYDDVLRYPADVPALQQTAIDGKFVKPALGRSDLGNIPENPGAAKDPAAGDPQAPPSPASHAPAPAHADTSRKIIRSGEMEFEVDSFDTASNTIAKVVIEEGGYVSTTNSDKLPNGKVKGSIILRVPPDHLDTLVLKLRGIGDLRTQRIGAQDITKQYTDLQSALTAAQAMYDRLIDIVKTGKGQVKDLLEAEKQLGVWREKLEQLKGEINYYNNMVSLSTLTVTLFERDIRTPAFASETETVNMNLETEKVDEAYAKIREAITAAKGRIVAAELKQFDAGQLGGKITAQLPPDAADGVINRIRQLDGRVTHFERQHSQSLSNGGAPADQRADQHTTDPLKVKREDVTLSLTLYNLANVAPRRTTSLTLVAGNVEEAYRALIAQVRSAGGRVITSQINRPKPDQVAGSVSFNVPAEKADVILGALRGAGEVLGTDTAEAPDSLNVTESKRGFNVTVASLSAFQARESQQVHLAAANVPEAFNDLLTAVRAKGGRILTSQLNEQDARSATGKLDFEIARESVSAIDQAMRKGQIISRAVTRSTDTQNTVDSKVYLAVQIGAAATLPPRQTTDLSVEANDVQKSLDDLVAAALAAGGRQVDSPAFSQADGAQTTATVVLDVPLDQVRGLIDRADAMGSRKGRTTSIDANAPEGKLARARLQVTFATPAALAGKDDGVWAGVRNGLGISVRWLTLSLTLIIVGLCVVVPLFVVIWTSWRLAGVLRGRNISPNTPAVGTALGT